MLIQNIEIHEEETSVVATKDRRLPRQRRPLPQWSAQCYFTPPPLRLFVDPAAGFNHTALRASVIVLSARALAVGSQMVERKKAQSEPQVTQQPSILKKKNMKDLTGVFLFAPRASV